MLIRRTSASILIGLSLVLVYGCGSKNQDSLIGKNVNENAAMMDANDIDANGSTDNIESAAPERSPSQPPVETNSKEQETPGEPVNLETQTDNSQNETEPETVDSNQE